MDNPRPTSHLLFAILMAALLALPILGLLADPARGDIKNDERSSQLEEGCKAGLIKGALSLNNHLNNHHIGIDVTGNTVRLTGVVSSEEKRALAEQIALSVGGIDEVRNELAVDSRRNLNPKQDRQPTDTFTDAAVSTRVKSQLLANTETSGLNIEVETDDRVVTLTGEVPSDVEKELAYYVVRNTGGVRHVVNKIQVKPQA